MGPAKTKLVQLLDSTEVEIRRVSRLELLAADEGEETMLRLGIVRPISISRRSDRSTTSCCASSSPSCSRPTTLERQKAQGPDVGN
jgi:hypothetical protein